MIRDWVARAASALLSGPLLVAALAVPFVAVIAVVDEVRAARRRRRVREAARRATEERIAELVPAQRDGDR